MAECVELLDKALALSCRELAWLREQNVEKAVECSGERGLLMEQAWEAYGRCPDTTYNEKLKELSRMQELLTKEAREKWQAIRAGLGRSRKESRRLAGYQMAVHQARMQ